MNAEPESSGIERKVLAILSLPVFAFDKVQEAVQCHLVLVELWNRFPSYATKISASFEGDKYVDLIRRVYCLEEVL